MAYIDREKALEICEQHYQHCLEMHDYCGDTTADNIKEDIEKMPTADVVEVIRCKDCQHWNPIGFAENGGWCEKKDIASLHNGFCESGEGKSDE